MSKKLEAWILAAAVFLITAAAVPCARAEGISAKASIVLDARSMQVLYEKNADEPLAIASITKIMTCLVALENGEPESIVTVPYAATVVGGTSLYLKAGEELPLEELLFGMMLESGNDAAVAVAVHVAGSVAAFVELMNDRAAALGCLNTRFVNPSGLPASGHRSSARDMALIMAAAMENESFRRITATRTIAFADRSFTNHNKLLWTLEGCVGGKTGYTKSAGRTLVSCVERNGLRLICVTLDDPRDWDDHAALYEELFSRWRLQEICHAGVAVDAVPVVSGARDTVEVAPEESLRVLTDAEGELCIKLELPQFVYARVEKGAPADVLRVSDGERELGSVRLLYAETVEQDAGQRLSFWERLRRSFSLS